MRICGLRRARLAAQVAALCVISGCAVGPHYQRPSAPVPAAFKEAPPDGWKDAEPADAIPRGAWWQIYVLPDLDALEQQVRISNQNVIAAIAQYREARDQIRIARSALFPTVNTAPSATITRANSSARTGAGNVITTQGSGFVVDYSLPVDFAYQADLWGSVHRSVTAAQATAQASEGDLENILLMNQAQLAQLYFQLRGLDGDAALLQTTMQLYDQSLQLTKDRMQAGVASGLDVAQAQAQYDSTRAQYIDVGVGRAQFEHAIAVLMGRPPSALTIPPSPVMGLPPPVPIGLPSALLERRPDISAAERLMAAANEEIGIAKAAFYPALSLNAAGGFASTSIETLLTWPSRFWAVAPTLALTLFDAGKRHAQVDLQEAAYDATVATYRQTVLTSFQQVEDQLAALRILEQEAAAEDQAVRAAQEALDIANEQYRAGTVDYLQVITAQTTALQAQRTALDILTRRLVASVLLVEALGGGWVAP
jgi:NodT family efflux transporter outer membrane factor (OMF) lipoprotein